MPTQAGKVVVVSVVVAVVEGVDEAEEVVVVDQVDQVVVDQEEATVAHLVVQGQLQREVLIQVRTQRL